MRRILVIEDDPTTAETVRLYLERADFEVHVVADGKQGLAEARAGSYLLIVLDLMLPGLSGTEVARALRRESGVPIVMLTARTTEDDRIVGLDLGADDYVAKPFSPRELVARVRAVLRRSEHPEAGGRQVLHFDGLTLDLRARAVEVDGAEVALTPTEFKLLAVLARSPGRLFRREQLTARAFGDDYRGLDRTVDAHVMNLRKKIEPNPGEPRFVQTVFGEGYRFAAKPR